MILMFPLYAYVVHSHHSLQVFKENNINQSDIVRLYTSNHPQPSSILKLTTFDSLDSRRFSFAARGTAVSRGTEMLTALTLPTD